MRARGSVVFLTIDTPYIDRRILLFAKTLSELDFDVSIVSPFSSETGFSNIRYVNLLESPDTFKGNKLQKLKEILKKVLPKPGLYLVRSFYRMARGEDSLSPFLKLMKEKVRKLRADIYVACDLPTLPAGLLAKKLHNSKLIYDAHEFYPEQTAFSFLERKWLQVLESNLVKQVDMVITVNEDIANLFRKRYLIEDVEVIYNATVENTEPISYKIYELIPNLKGREFIIYHGGFIPYRNLELLIELSSYLKDLALVMVGWGELEDQLKELSEKIGVLNSKVFFIPKRPQSELVRFIMPAKFGLIPYPAVDLNTKFCTPNKLFEYIQAKVPIIANRELVTTRKVLERYKIGTTVNFSDLKETAQLIERLSNFEEEYKLFKSNLEIASRELCWERESVKLKSVISKITSENEDR